MSDCFPSGIEHLHFAFDATPQRIAKKPQPKPDISLDNGYRKSQLSKLCRNEAVEPVANEICVLASLVLLFSFLHSKQPTFAQFGQIFSFYSTQHERIIKTSGHRHRSRHIVSLAKNFYEESIVLGRRRGQQEHSKCRHLFTTRATGRGLR